MWCWGRFSFTRCKVIPKTGMMTGDQIREHAERTMAKNLDISVDRYQNLKRISHNNSELLYFLHRQGHDLNNASCESLIRLSSEAKKNQNALENAKRI